MYNLRGSDPGKREAVAETVIVRAARAFGEGLARHDPRGRLELDDLTLSAMREHSEDLRNRGDEIAGSRWYPRPDR